MKAAMKKGYYSDGITKFTDPFWTVKCNTCGTEHWSLTYIDYCPECYSKDIACTNPKIKGPSS